MHKKRAYPRLEALFAAREYARVMHKNAIYAVYACVLYAVLIQFVTQCGAFCGESAY